VLLSEPLANTAETASDWHARTPADVARALGVDPHNGLTAAEAAQRLARYGPNRLAQARQEPWWRELVESLREPLQLLLIGVAVVYALIGEFEDALTIFVVIVAVSAVEVATETRAKRAIASLRTMSAPTTTVLRGGAPVEIIAADVVPGDAVLLEAGDRIVADLRLVESIALRVDESSLTGESVPVSKDASAVLPLDTELGDRSTLTFAGTTVTAGKGSGLVVATGPTTELGRIATLTESAREPRTPLQLQMRQLGGWLLWVALGFSVVVPVLGVFVAGRPVQEMVLTGLTLAFATIPEELPILITIVLGLGAYRLTRERAIVKRLRAAETLGSVSVVGTDKTGTLTENRMRVAEIVTSDGRLDLTQGTLTSKPAARLLEIGVLASDARVVHTTGRTAFVGDPTETALLAAAETAGFEVSVVRTSVSPVQEYPFDDTRKRMSVVVEQGGVRWLLLKGAPESVLAICSQDEPEGDLQQAQQTAEAMAARGQRVLAFAERQLQPDELLSNEPGVVEHDMVLVGLAGLADPARPEVPGAIAALHAAGVRVLMLTGDHPATALAVAQQVGIDTKRVVRGRDLDNLTETDLREVVVDASVFARITPEHKLRLVRALQAHGEIVAVTGDGVNDGPALREAAVGIAMGQAGTDVAREAAAVVLADDNFATLAVAVRGGRVLFANLRKAVRYYLAAKVALVTASVVAVLAHLPVPFEPVQIIVLELFMDLGASTTFVGEPPEQDVMARPPRDPRRPFMDRAMQVGILGGGLSLVDCQAILDLDSSNRMRLF
jgi:Ca2+-transporting ATPase